ncbi:hypothetical protein ONZ43_g2868 [Nemania bipapillata]|uniref:Uncharacterized protein n=1 Tax=Nemania bipapillata TaxID=110536 RepID=A0ACC2IZ17_9PEZI|nr:hypothetical protein ONZ43_g2868 [Nemania bipapillata]
MSDEKGVDIAEKPINQTMGAETLIKELEAARTTAEKIAREWEDKYNEREKALSGIILEKWALEYEKMDKLRDIRMLEAQLANSIPLGDWKDPPPKLRTALEIGQQERIKALQDENTRLWKKIKSLEGDEGEQQPGSEPGPSRLA